tara:strand:- start:992 stop:1345 length:354 start_codon:yes stop_codon:yes gene_type:complete
MKNVKAYKTIGEVSKLINVEPHVLRLWEENLSQIKPLKRKGGRRLYSQDNINIIRTVKVLIYEEGYTIKGVKKFFSKNKLSQIKEKGQIQISEELAIKLEHINSYLLKAKSILKNES